MTTDQVMTRVMTWTLWTLDTMTLATAGHTVGTSEAPVWALS